MNRATRQKLRELIEGLRDAARGGYAHAIDIALRDSGDSNPDIPQLGVFDALRRVDIDAERALELLGDGGDDAPHS
jgi:hypothetical protein